MKYLTKAIELILELIYPNRCICCDEVLEFGEDPWLCHGCAEKVKPITGKVCRVCGVPIAANDICSDCSDKKLYFKRAYCAFEYKNEVRQAIHNIKFNNCPRYLKYFADILCSYANDRGFEGADIVTFVPMRPKNRRKRGYNQSELLAKELARRGMGEFMPLLLKVKDTKNQHDIAKEERRKNLKNAFAPIDPDKIKGKKILLADDIYTTGSTANECAKTLIKAGAQSVEVICIAIVNKRDPNMDK